MAKYQRGTEFPNEGFVQKVIEDHFGSFGFQLQTDGHADLICIDKEEGITWIIEAKGKTSAIGLDFRTGLGQIMTRMDDPKANYAVAIPEIPQFERLAGEISRWVREVLNLHWIFVAENGSVRIDPPGEDIEI